MNEKGEKGFPEVDMSLWTALVRVEKKKILFRPVRSLTGVENNTETNRKQRTYSEGVSG